MPKLVKKIKKQMKKVNFKKIKENVGFAAAVIGIATFTTSYIPEVYAVVKNMNDKPMMHQELTYNFEKESFANDYYYVDGNSKIVISYTKDAFDCYGINYNQRAQFVDNIVMDVLINTINQNIKKTNYANFNKVIQQKLPIDLSLQLNKVVCYENSKFEIKYITTTLYKQSSLYY